MLFKIASPVALCASEVERWSCTNDIATTNWTIIDGRMFAPKGKGYFTVVENSPSLTISYMLFRTKQKQTISHVMVLDKAAKKIIEYDDADAVIFGGTFGQPYEVKAAISPCKRD